MTLQELIAAIAADALQEPTETKIKAVIAELWPIRSTLIDNAASAGDDGDSANGMPAAGLLFEATLLTAARTDRPWVGAAVAIQGAIHTLLKDVEHPLQGRAGECVAFCASEMGGNRPSAIETTVQHDASGGLVLNGRKRWATLGPMASHLVVIASERQDSERNHLRAAVIPTDRSGVFIEEMTIPGSMPNSLRLPHSLINLDGVAVDQNELMVGDGYSAFMKPYRTIEDAFGVAAQAASLLAMALRHGAEAEAVDGVVALIASLRAVVLEDLTQPSSHLVVSAAEKALPALIPAIAAHLPDDIASWWVVEDGVAVAPTAKGLRRSRALERLLE